MAGWQTRNVPTFVGVLIAVLAAGALVGAFVRWAGARNWIFFGNHEGSSSSMGGLVGELTELFQPGRRIEHEERQRAKEARQQSESGDPPFEVDLDAGTARLRMKRSPDSER